MHFVVLLFLCWVFDWHVLKLVCCNLQSVHAGYASCSVIDGLVSVFGSAGNNNAVFNYMLSLATLMWGIQTHTLS